MGSGEAAAQDNFWSASGHLDNIAKSVNLKKNDAPTIIGTIISGVLGFLGVLFLIIIIYGGLRLMAAGGNEETVQGARATIKWAIIGVMFVIGAYALSYYVVNQVLESTTKAPPTPVIPGEGMEDEALGDVCEGVNCVAHFGNAGACLNQRDGNIDCCWYDSDTKLCSNLY